MSISPCAPNLTTLFGQGAISSGVATPIVALSGLADGNPNGNFRIIFFATMTSAEATQQLMSIVQVSASQLGATLVANVAQYGTTQSGTDAGALSATFTADTSVLGTVSLSMTLSSSSMSDQLCTLSAQLEGRNTYKTLIAFL